jgi:hypothetical protein
VPGAETEVSRTVKVLTAVAVISMVPLLTDTVSQPLAAPSVPPLLLRFQIMRPPTPSSNWLLMVSCAVSWCVPASIVPPALTSTLATLPVPSSWPEPVTVTRLVPSVLRLPRDTRRVPLET